MNKYKAGRIIVFDYGGFEYIGTVQSVNKNGTYNIHRCQGQYNYFNIPEGDILRSAKYE